MGFGPAPDVCEAVDYSPVFDIVASDRLEGHSELGGVSVLSEPRR
jgi:hypothetical protein